MSGSTTAALTGAGGVSTDDPKGAVISHTM